jgi:Essential protein Yae1, N terminal
MRLAEFISEEADSMPAVAALPVHEVFHEIPSENRHDLDLDDVWDSEPSPLTTHRVDVPNALEAHPSDIPRLQAKHSTAGYREGITIGKGQSIQVGFDEGYSLGAALGSKVGEIIGILESIAAALRSVDHDVAADAESRLAEARRDLAREKIFGPDYWEEDGTWKYEVKGDSQHTIFTDVATAHPVIHRWIQILDVQMERWNITHVAWENTGEALPETSENPSAHPLTSAKKPLDW